MGCHALLQENLPNQGVKPESFKSLKLAGRFFTTSATWEVQRSEQLLDIHRYMIVNLRSVDHLQFGAQFCVNVLFSGN